MEYFFWSNVVVWSSLVAYAFYLYVKSNSARKKLRSFESDRPSGGES